MSDLEYIKKFSKIKIARICRDLNITPSNLWSGKLKAEKIHKVRKVIESEIGGIYVEENNKTR